MYYVNLIMTVFSTKNLNKYNKFSSEKQNKTQFLRNH